MITKEEKSESLPCASFVQVGRFLDETPDLGCEHNNGGGRGEAADNKDCILILNEVDKPEAMSAVSLTSFDVEAVDDMIGAIKMRERIIYILSFTFVLSIAFLWHALCEAKGREQVLQTRLDEIIKEDAMIKFDQVMNRSDETIFAVENCYFNFRATGALGQCAEDVTRSVYDFYEWGVDTLNLLLEDN
eukprot:scaffold6388_cov267-Chaetoceros_neogracile.AAC.5